MQLSRVGNGSKRATNNWLSVTYDIYIMFTTYTLFQNSCSTGVVQVCSCLELSIGQKFRNILYLDPFCTLIHSVP